MRQECTKKVALILFLACMLFLPHSPTVSAAPSDLVVKAEAGFAGQARIGSWIPVYVEIENPGGDITASVSITFNDQRGYGATQLVQDVHLPQGSRKRVVMRAPVNEMLRHLEVTVTYDGKTATARAPLQTHPMDNLLCGVLSSDSVAMSHLGTVALPMSKVAVVSLDADTLPDEMSVIKALDVIIISDFDSAQLSSTQLETLRSWVASGGVLVTAGGPMWQKSLKPLPEELMPVDVHGSVLVDSLDELAALGEREFGVSGPYPVSTATLKDGSMLMAEQELIPILVQRQYGSGRVLYFAADLTLDPLAYWAGNNKMWQNLFGMLLPWVSAGIPREMMRDAYYGHNQMSWALRNLPGFAIPETKNLVLLLLGYALLIGPASYFALRRMRRVELTWLSVPLLAVICAGILYGVGFYQTGRDVFTNTIAVARIDSSESVSVNTYIGVFAPSKRNYSLSFEGKVDVLPLPMDYYWYASYSEQPPVTTRVVLSSDTKVEFPNMGMWTMQAVEVREQASLGGGIETRLLPHATGLKGEVTNNTQYKLTDCLVVTADSFFRVGDLLPGETKSVDMSITFDPKLLYGPSIADRILDYDRQQVRFQEVNRELLRKRQVLSTVIGNQYEIVHPVLADVVFLGWTDTPLTATLPKTRLGSQAPYMGLVAAPLSVTVPDERFSVPPGIVKASLQSSSFDRMKIGPGFYFLSDKSEISFWLDLPVGAERIEWLTVHLAGTSYGSRPLEGEIYNWTTGMWDNWTVAIGDSVVPEPHNYVSEDGKFQFKLRSAGGEIEMRDPTVSFGGRAAQ